MHKFLYLTVALACILRTDDTVAQWTHLASFDTSSILTIYFKDSEGEGHVGLLSTVHYGRPSHAGSWLTIDSGKSWRKVATTDNHPPVVFTFKDKDIGWSGGAFTGWQGGCEGRFQITRDGGETWQALPEPACVIDLFYDKIREKLWLSDMQPQSRGLRFSEDYGYNYTGVDSRIFGGFTQSESGYMILSGSSLDNPSSPHLYSIDGKTWKEANYDGLTVSPTVMDEVFFELDMSARPYCIRRSDDHGATWTFVANLPREIGTPTAVLRSNSCGLYMQSNFGLYRSKDAGLTWDKLGDIGSYIGSKFYLQGNTVFVPRFRSDTLPGELWKYVDPIELRLPSSLVLNGCNVDTAVSLYYDAACFAGELISFDVDQTGTGLAIEPPSLPRQVNGDLRLPIRYIST